MKPIIFLFLLSSFTWGCLAQSASDTPPLKTGKEGAFNITAMEFHDLMNDGTEGLVIDVRTPQETGSGVLPGARKLNINDASFDQQVGQLEKDKPVFVYCRSGARSASAMQRMKSLGFKEVYNLSGGIIAWERAGFPIIKG